MRFDRRWAVAAVLAGLLLLFFGLDLGRFLSLDYVKSRQAELEAWRAARPLLAAGLFFAGCVLVAALSLPGALVMTLAAGAIFGPGWGVLIVSFASTIGATLAFLAARWLFGDAVRARFGPRLAAIDAGIARDGGLTLFTLRLVPVVPFFVVNPAMGVTTLRTWTCYWVSQLGMLAGTGVYVNAGTPLARIDSLSGIVSPGLPGSLALLGAFPLVARKSIDRLQSRKVYARRRRPRRFDRNLIVIGGGSAGLVSACIAAALKARVTLVEKHAMGGDCLDTGCVPSKALIRSARFLSHVRRAREFGIRSAGADFDFGEVMERVQRIVEAVGPHDSAARYSSLGVDVALGTARVVSPWEVQITHRDGRVRNLSTRAIVIAAGARPFVPPIPGLDMVQVLTSDNVWQLRRRPERLVVLGGGPIGCELTQAFARLGSRVTQVEMLPRILAREDPEVSALVTERFRAEGIDVRVGHKALRVLPGGLEKVPVVDREGRETRPPFDAILVAVGRSANLKGCGLEELGVTTDRTVQVNGWLQTHFPNIDAAGDVAGPYQFTRAAAHQACYAAVNALFDPFKKFRPDDRVIPWATFVEPEVARVGLNELDAREKGAPFEVTRFGLDELDRAIADGEAHGFVKVLTVPGKDRILGVTILGTIHTCPTLAEAGRYVAGNWKRAHAPQKLLQWVERFHAWRRG